MDNQFNRPLRNVPTEELIEELKARNLISNEMTICLECCKPISAEPILNSTVECECGHAQKVTLSWRLEG